MPALGTITGVINRFRSDLVRPQVAQVILTCTGSVDDGSFPITVWTGLSGIAVYDLRGLRLHDVKVIAGTTGPTNLSNMTITDSYGVDLLDGAGLLFIPNSGSAWTNLIFLPAIITGDTSITITGNLVHSAVITVVLDLIGI